MDWEGGKGKGRRLSSLTDFFSPFFPTAESGPRIVNHAHTALKLTDNNPEVLRGRVGGGGGGGGDVSMLDFVVSTLELCH